MKHNSCPKCGSFLTHSTAGAKCCNTFCGWEEFPQLKVSILTTGTTNEDKKYPTSTGITEEMKLRHIANMLLNDLIDHHNKMIHTKPIPNNCATCALIQDAKSILGV